MPYCSYCAGVLEINQHMCPRCGRAVDSRPAPAAAVTAAAPSAGRPSSVQIATMLLLASCGVSLFAFLALVFARSFISRLPVFYIARSFGLLVLWAVLTICVWQRQQWARIGVTLLMAWSVANVFVTIVRVGGSIAMATTFLVTLLVAALRLGAVVLLFKSDSSAWFKK